MNNNCKKMKSSWGKSSLIMYTSQRSHHRNFLLPKKTEVEQFPDREKKNNPNNNLYDSLVVYKYTCPSTECKHSQNYISCTATTVKQRMTSNLQNGPILTQASNTHNLKLKNQQNLENFKVIYKSTEKIDLILAETHLFDNNS